MSKVRRYMVDIKIIESLKEEDKLWFIIDKINKECGTVDSKYYALRGYLEYINDNNTIGVLKSEFNKLIENSYDLINKVLFLSDYNFKAVAIWLVFQGEFFYKKMHSTLLKEYFEVNNITEDIISEYLCIANVFDESLNILQLASTENLHINTYYPTKKMVDYTDEYSSLLWNIIDMSRMDAKFNNRKQYDNLVRLLDKFENNAIEGLMRAWREISYSYNYSSSNEFEKLHVINGGIVEGGDDAFFIDFTAWLVAQGKELYYDFIDRGSVAIIEYIEKNKISSDDYTYENMGYVWQDVCDKKGINY